MITVVVVPSRVLDAFELLEKNRMTGALILSFYADSKMWPNYWCLCVAQTFVSINSTVIGFVMLMG